MDRRMNRVRDALTQDYGRQVPSGYRLYGWMLWLAAIALIVTGLGLLISGTILLGSSLTAAGLLVIAQTFTGPRTPS